MDARIEAALAAAVPDREATSVDAAGPSWNDANDTVRVAFADGSAVYLKVAADGNGTRIARERAVVAAVGANTTVPVPEVLAADPDGDPPYLVTAPVDGTNFLAAWPDDEAGQRALYRAFGRTLARVHARRFDAHGRVVAGDADGLTVDPAPWSEVLCDYVAWLRGVSPDDRYDDHFDRVAAAVREASDLLAPAPAALLHGDPSRPNVFRTQNGDLGLLDWEQAVVGDPVRELVRVREQQLGPTRGDARADLLTAFHGGYRDVAGELPAGYETRRPVYEAVRLLGVSGYFHRTAEFEGADEDALGAWLEGEMDRRLDAVTDAAAGAPADSP